MGTPEKKSGVTEQCPQLAAEVEVVAVAVVEALRSRPQNNRRAVERRFPQFPQLERARLLAEPEEARAAERRRLAALRIGRETARIRHASW